MLSLYYFKKELMSKLNILGVVKQIRNKSNAYLPIIEAIVNSIDSIKETGRNVIFACCLISCLQQIKSENKALVKKRTAGDS